MAGQISMPSTAPSTLPPSTNTPGLPYITNPSAVAGVGWKPPYPGAQFGSTTPPQALYDMQFRVKQPGYTPQNDSERMLQEMMRTRGVNVNPQWYAPGNIQTQPAAPTQAPTQPPPQLAPQTSGGLLASPQQQQAGPYNPNWQMVNGRWVRR